MPTALRPIPTIPVHTARVYGPYVRVVRIGLYAVCLHFATVKFYEYDDVDVDDGLIGLNQGREVIFCLFSISI